ncbi:unnamed protein product [Danaus chrysippus]|uniref:(African queen) hypothetical protein n=1 Tax=Danaus chrysippus TaxID=151541 RepID=A0A8J2VZB7_9NEOP|nr:unnamed protein product [Danaus chrysippus]
MSSRSRRVRRRTSDVRLKGRDSGVTTRPTFPSDLGFLITPQGRGRSNARLRARDLPSGGYERFRCSRLT